MELVPIVRESWGEFKKIWKPMLLATYPFLIASVLISAFYDSEGASDEFIKAVLETMLDALIVLFGLKVVYEHFSVEVTVSGKKILAYILSVVLIAIAALLGFLLFIVPGILVLTTSWMYPIYLLKEDRGPIDAVACSVAAMKPYMVKITLALVGLWSLLSVCEAILSAVSGALLVPESVANILLSTLYYGVVLYLNPLMVIMHRVVTSEDDGEAQLADWKLFKTIFRIPVALVGLLAVIYLVNPFQVNTYALAPRLFGYTLYYIPASSMSPTLQVGDYVLVDATRYSSDTPKLNDVVVFKFPKSPDVLYVKRVIAGGGQTVTLKNGQVYVDGSILDQSYVYPPNSFRTRKLNQTFQVPQGKLFVMGDNRDNSNDSRYWGFVPVANVVGQVSMVFFSRVDGRIGMDVK